MALRDRGAGAGALFDTRYWDFTAKHFHQKLVGAADLAGGGEDENILRLIACMGCYGVTSVGNYCRIMYIIGNKI